jgi:hypothetical protein
VAKIYFPSDMVHTHVIPALRRLKEEDRKFQATRCWWLTPVILAIQEAEIRRIMVQSQGR